MELFFFSYLAGFSYLAWRHFPAALGLFFFLLPTYMLRFQIGQLPTTLLEGMFLVLFGVFLVRHASKEKMRELVDTKIQFLKQFPFLSASIFLFLLGATIGIFFATNTRAALGEWRAFYLEPIILFWILLFSIKTKKDLHNILIALLFSGLLTSILAIYQKFTGWMVPYDFWENRNTYRVTGWYGFPNGVGLFLAPLVPIAMYMLSEYRKQKTHPYFLLELLYIPLALAAIVFAKTTGAIIGILGAIGVLLLLNKKTRIPALILGTVGITSIFFLPTDSKLRIELLMQDESGQLRLDMWEETIELAKDRPLIGAGMASYTETIVPYRQDKKVEIFHHPHNLFLTIWANTGLIGLIGFIAIIAWFIFFALRNQESFLVKILLASFVVILVSGLVDSPYIKNDWAIVFWMLPALLIVSRKNNVIT